VHQFCPQIPQISNLHILGLILKLQTSKFLRYASPLIANLQKKFIITTQITSLQISWLCHSSNHNPQICMTPAIKRKADIISNSPKRTLSQNSPKSFNFKKNLYCINLNLSIFKKKNDVFAKFLSLQKEMGMHIPIPEITK
jgi:hypothetical protein